MTETHRLRPPLPELHSVIGVWHQGPQTYYVKRSEGMTNYPGIWSLLSKQFDPKELPNPEDLSVVQRIMERLSSERLGGVAIATKKHLTSDDSDDNPIDRHVFLHLYEVEVLEEPRLNPDFYADGSWLTPEAYEEKSAGQKCGLCLRLWSDYAWLAGISDRPFIPRAVGYDD